LILGGIIDSKEQAVREAFTKPDLQLAQRDTQEDWVSLTFHRSA
jgi:ribosomal protein L11 methylase PrmA